MSSSENETYLICSEYVTIHIHHIYHNTTFGNIPYVTIGSIIKVERSVTWVYFRKWAYGFFAENTKRTSQRLQYKKIYRVKQKNG
jgi:hypothetical protein